MNAPARMYAHPSEPEVPQVPDPLQVQKKAASLIYEHIAIPELSLAVVCENSYISFDTKLRRIHSRRFTDNNVLSRFKNHLLFNKKMGTELLKGAVSTLRLALASHDKLESFYIDAMDFSKTEILTSELEQKIFKNC